MVGALGDFDWLPKTYCLDCEHDCRSEVHPVDGFAVEASDHADDNVWVMFVRNWGNEGFCSQFDHQMHFADNKITLMLPGHPKARQPSTFKTLNSPSQMAPALIFQ
jgi:hypothetical protein